MQLPSLIGREKLAVMARLAEITPPGPFLEVGVYKGGSSQILYEICERQGRSLYLYDTFTGIPHEGEFDSHKVGDFGDANLETIRRALPEAMIQKGIFPSEEFVVPGRISFVHLDVDQEQSYKESLDFLMPRMIRGAMILCDDYCLIGAARAIDAVSDQDCVKTELADGRVLLIF